MFPGGVPGIGLLLLRVAVGGPCVAEAVGRMLSARDPSSYALLAVCGGLLLLGLLTPFAAVVAGVMAWWFQIGGVLGNPFLFGLVPAAIAMLGPGAFSVDARWFGRREIVFPPGEGRR